MDEATWLASADPMAMLSCATNHPARVPPSRPATLASDRKLRLFAVAACRQVWDKLTDPSSRRAVEIAGKYADGEATTEELEAVQHAVMGRLMSAGEADINNLVAYATECYVRGMAWATQQIAERCQSIVPPATQAALLHDIFGNPHRPWKCQCDLDVNYRCEWCYELSSWLRWNGRTVPRIAQRMYDSLDFRDMPILHDALLDAGCDVEDMLMHCRGEERCWHKSMPDMASCPDCSAGWRPLRGPHVRGCWVVDLLLGKE